MRTTTNAETTRKGIALNIPNHHEDHTAELKPLLGSLTMYISYVKKSTMTSGNEYAIRLYRGNINVAFRFHDNYLNEIEADGYPALMSLIMDYWSWYDSQTPEETMCSGCYETYAEASRMCKGLKSNHDKAIKLFTEQELDLLTDLTMCY